MTIAVDLGGKATKQTNKCSFELPRHVVLKKNYMYFHFVLICRADIERKKEDLRTMVG